MGAIEMPQCRNGSLEIPAKSAVALPPVARIRLRSRGFGYEFVSPGDADQHLLDNAAIERGAVWAIV
jgi:hypothetical protein